MFIARYIYYPCAVILACIVVASSLEAARLMRIASEAQSLQGATELAWKTLLEKWSFSLYSGAEDVRAMYTEIVAEAESYRDLAALASLVLGALTIAQLMVIRFGSRREFALMAWHAILISIIAFTVGIVAPMLTVLAYSDVPVLGTVILKYDTKSIVSTIGQLIATKNVFLALLIALFSIIFPVFKVSLMLAALAPALERSRHRCIEVMHAIGKWSMVDVFVVSVVVAFLAFSKDDLSDARVGLGLYYFAAYCILSLLAAHFVSTRE
jgi:paraquat-inducible protein A